MAVPPVTNDYENDFMRKAQAKMDWEAPAAQGLYDPQNEHEACGVGFIVAIDGRRTHKILRDAQTLSSRMNHRGACACDNDTGDGAGVMTAIPHDYYVKEMAKQNVTLRAFGRYATGMIYMDKITHSDSEKDFTALASSLGISVLVWRAVPTEVSAVGQVARKSEPLSRQVFVTADLSEKDLVLQVFVLRKRPTHELTQPGRRFYICSLSIKTIVYKGLFTSDQLWNYYLDLLNPEFESYLALVHTRFSTNTFPLRVLAHNGEINTLRGNVNLMKAREGIVHNSNNLICIYNYSNHKHMNINVSRNTYLNYEMYTK